MRALRTLRAELGLKPKQLIEAHVAEVAEGAWDLVSAFEEPIRTLARVSTLERIAGSEPPRGAAVVVAGGVEIHVPIGGLVDVAAERERLGKEIERVDRDLEGVRRKLSNPSFLARAPEEVVAKERAKASDLEERRALLARGMERLAGVDL